MNKDKLKSFTKKIEKFDTATHVEKIIIFGYYLTNIEKQKNFTSKSISECYKLLDKFPPENIPDSLKKMHSSGKIIPSDGGYRLEGSIADKLEEKFSMSKPMIAVSEKLWKLYAKMKKPEKDFFKEVLDCFSVEAWRAVIVLVWIITIDHLQNYVLKKKLVEFNQVLSTPPGYKKIKLVTKKEDFEDIKESDFIHILRTAKIISKNQNKILEQKLDFRNTYAHASSQILHESTTTSFIEELVDNIVLKIK